MASAANWADTSRAVDRSSSVAATASGISGERWLHSAAAASSHWVASPSTPSAAVRHAWAALRSRSVSAFGQTKPWMWSRIQFASEDSDGESPPSDDGGVAGSTEA